MENTGTDYESERCVVACTSRKGGKIPSRLYAELTPQEWRGIVSASAIGNRTPEKVIKTAIREYLTRCGIIIEPKIAPYESELQAQNRVLVMSKDGHIVRQFLCFIPCWAFDALQFAARNDAEPIGRTTAAAIYHFAAHRGIEPPHRMKAEVEKIVERAHLAENSDIPEMIRDERGGFRRLLNLRQWEREAVRAVANHDGDAAGRTIAHAVRYYVTKVRGVEPPPQAKESVERIRTDRDCAFVKLHTGNGQETPPPEAATGTPPTADGESLY